MGTARLLVAVAALGLIASSCWRRGGSADPPAPTARPATYGVPHPIGGPEHQWSLMITVNALGPNDTSWYRDQTCDPGVEEVMRRQQRFSARLDVALTDVLSRNGHCAVAALAPLTYGQSGCSESAVSQPSGVYAVFSCPNGEPLNTTR